MNTIKILVKEFEQEAQTTRKMLSLVPEEQFSWKPHAKSMSLEQLATHIADIPGWIDWVLSTEELDFATHHEPVPVSTTRELLQLFEESYTRGKARLEKAGEADLIPTWTMRNGGNIFSVEPKADVLRMCFSQTVHHRAQLGVYLRLLNIPIPGSYGPSADEIEAHANFQPAVA